MIKLLLYLIILISTNAYSHENKDIIDFQEYQPRALPEVEFYDKDNNKHLLEEFDNNILVIHFWATWCTVCAKELPELDRLKKDFKKKPVKIIAISEDFKNVETIIDFYNKNNIQYLEVFHDRKNQLFSAFNIIGLPTTIFVNSNNMEIGRIVGKIDWNTEEMKQKILSLDHKI